MSILHELRSLTGGGQNTTPSWVTIALLCIGRSVKSSTLHVHEQIHQRKSINHVKPGKRTKIAATLRSVARAWTPCCPSYQRCVGNWAFCVAGPMAWNSLPSDIRSRTASSVTTSKNLLKTTLFIQLYYST